MSSFSSCKTKQCLPLLTTVLLLVSSCLHAQNLPTMAGAWIIDEELSDNTDRQVEAALKAAGEKIKRSWFNRKKDYYRGGPEEQELYDRLSYDKTLTIELEKPTYFFTYDDNYRRPVYTDNRSRSVSLNAIDHVQDFSFAHWEEDKLLVEARPRDGGFAEETYTLSADGQQLQVELYIKPRVFEVPIEIHRVYQRHDGGNESDFEQQAP